MASTISAGTTTTTALSYSADTSGVLQLQTNGGTTALTLDTSQNATFAGKVASASSLQLATNGTTTAITVDTSQNVGIGTSSPAYKLDVTGSARIVSSSGLFLNGSTANGSMIFSPYIGNDFSFQWYGSTTTTAVPLKFINGNTEQMRIDISGNLLVGTTNTAPGSGNTATGCVLNGSLGLGYFSRANDASLIMNSNADGKVCRIYRSGTECGSIQITTTTTNYVSGSDYRLKTVIGAISDSGSRIDALEPIEYTWNSTGLRTRGFLAHKFQEVYENSVFGTKDAVDENGNPEYQSMEASSAEVIADLVAEIQSIRKRLTALKG